MGRPLYTLEKRRSESGGFLITSDDSANPTILATWTIGKFAFPDFSTLNFRIVGDMFISTGGDGDPATTVGYGVIIGGGPLDLVGTATDYALLEGGVFEGPTDHIFGSPLLEIDGSALFSGRDMEFVKLVGWYDVVFGAQPSSDNFSLMISGPSS